MPTSPVVRDVSNPACVGMEFTSTDNYVWQFVFFPNVVGFSVKPNGGTWSPTTTIVAPERFGQLPAGHGPTKNDRKLAKAWAEAFLAPNKET